MAHWTDRPEPNWKKFAFRQPYAKGLERVRDVIANTDFDPATLWQWGTMQAMALIEVLKMAEGEFGEAGQKMVCDALRRTGLDVGRQILQGVEIPPEMTEAEFFSFYATVINCIVYASREETRIDSPEQVSFDIVFCPHQDHYEAFDCRVQRYFVQGMIEAAREIGQAKGWEVRFDSTIPAGAETCHFTVWKPTEGERDQWDGYTKLIEAKALARAKK